MVETHKTEIEDVKNPCFQHARRAYVNPAIKTSEKGSHGGEAIACLAHLNTMPIQEDILHAIEDQSAHALCFAACIIRLKGLILLLIVPYLYVGEGMSERNSHLVGQIDLLRCIVSLPFVAI